MDESTLQLAEVFARSINNDREIIKAAEERVKTWSQQPGYGVTALKVVAAGDALGLDVRQAAAVNFKNLVKYRWDPTEVALEHGTQPVSEEEKDHIKRLLTGLMLSTPPLVRAQLSEALALISGHDFPAKWPSLLPELVERLTHTEDLGVINGVLATANAIFKRYRGKHGSNQLINELEASQNLFMGPALDTLQKLWAAVGSGGPQLRELLSAARLVARIFYSLNSLGLTPLVESQLDVWMDLLHKFLTYDNAELVESDPEREGVLDALKSAVCDNINLFTEINDEEFEKYLGTFANDVWGLLVKVSPNPGQDSLAMAATRFLTTVARSVHAKLFEDPAVLRQVCESIIIPNLKVREEDEEVFDMNPVDYIRRDAEGSDSDTRRRAAAELLRALSDAYEASVAQLCGGYVTSMLQEYAAAPDSRWQAKDCALYLVMALTVKGKTGAQGATTTSSLVNVDEFFQQQVVPELADPAVNSRPILKADAIKFATLFRSRLPRPAALALLPHLIALLGSEHYVVHSYAATAIERLLALREPGSSTLRFSASDIAPHAQAMLTALFAAFKHPESSENEYVMRAIMRLISFLGPQIAPVAPTCLQALAAMLLEVCKNPRCPGFNHYLFEAVAALIRHGAPGAGGSTAAFESVLFPAFDTVLQQDVQEFHPYVFQVLAQLIELSTSPLGPVYMNIFPPLLTPLFWERPGNVPALTRLIQAYLSKAAPAVVAGGHLPALLGVFQKLIASKAHDTQGFAILESIIEFLPLDTYRQYLPTVWSLLFMRLQASRTPKFVRGFVLFFSRFIVAVGPVVAIETTDTVQQGVFLMLLQQVYTPNLSAVEGPDDDKLVAVAATKCLTQCPALFANRPMWEGLREALSTKLQGGGSDAAGGSGDALDEEGDEAGMGGYHAAYARLANAAPPERQVLAEIIDPRQFVENSLAQFMGQLQQPGGS